jgi:lipoprotein-anchoring transpeptidase ErfK/SrfK
MIMNFSSNLSRVAAIGIAAIAIAPVAIASAATVPTTTPTVTLLAPASVHTYPGANAPTTSVIADTRPLTGSPTVLPVIATATAEGTPWVEVRLPQRPDGSTGWISTAATSTSADRWFITVSRESFRAHIYDEGKLVQTFPVIVGKPSTPTPAGNFFVAEIVHEGYGIVSGPYALLTSDYSNVLHEFEGGPGQIALHGIVGLDDPMGTASSHGCMRFTDADVTWLAQHIPAGTPIQIH